MVSLPVRVAEKRCPPGMVNLEVDVIFRRIHLGGGRGGGNQRTPGDKVTAEKQRKQYIHGWALVGVSVIYRKKRGTYVPCVLYGALSPSVRRPFSSATISQAFV